MPDGDVGTIGLEAAIRRIGIGRSLGYLLAARGEFPCRVLKIGKLYRVPIADLERLLSDHGAVPVGAKR